MLAGLLQELKEVLLEHLLIEPAHSRDDHARGGLVVRETEEGKQDEGDG